jgi:hypothetical protein
MAAYFSVDDVKPLQYVVLDPASARVGRSLTWSGPWGGG